MKALDPTSRCEAEPTMYVPFIHEYVAVEPGLVPENLMEPWKIPGGVPQLMELPDCSKHHCWRPARPRDNL